jgi:DNA-binding beta-propeller fold protein YncE
MFMSPRRVNLVCNSPPVKVVKTSDGTFLSVFGEKGHGAGQFYTPSALCLSESAGRRWLWVGDDGAHRVQCFDLAHNPPRVRLQLGVTCEAGIYGSPAHVWQPCGVAALGGRLFVAEYGNDRVSVFDEQSGQRVGQIGGRRGPAPGQLAYPRGLGVDTERDLLYVSDYGNERVSIFRVAPPFAFVGIVPVKAPCGAAIEASLDAAFAPTVFIPQFVGQHISLFAGF